MYPDKNNTTRLILSLLGLIGFPVFLIFTIGGDLRVPGPVADPALVSRGAQLFAQSCAACHGVEGRGNPAMPDIPALDGTGEKSQLPDNELQSFILNGGDVMPAFRDVLEVKDVDSIIEQLHAWWEVGGD